MEFLFLYFIIFGIQVIEYSNLKPISGVPSPELHLKETDIRKFL
jgi:hypothetical protein